MGSQVTHGDRGHCRPPTGAGARPPAGAPVRSQPWAAAPPLCTTSPTASWPGRPAWSWTARRRRARCSACPPARHGHPAEFAAELSAEMAFSYLAAFDHHTDAGAVSNNHFDQDGLVGVFALSAPEDALARRDLLVEVARAGDFAVTGSPGRRPRLHGALGVRRPGTEPAGGPPRRLRRARPRCSTTSCWDGSTELCDRPERFRALWAEEDDVLTASEAALRVGRGDDHRSARRRPRRGDGARAGARRRRPPLRAGSGWPGCIRSRCTTPPSGVPC